MAESPSSTNLFGRQVQNSSTSRYSNNDDDVAKALDPKSIAMFAIPTHATTHAPGVSNEDLPDDAHSESSSEIRLEGRPAPTPTKLDAQFHMLQTQMHLEAHHSVASSVQSSSSQYTVTAQQYANRTKSVKRPQRALTQDTLRVDETASSLASPTSALPTYDRVIQGSPDELPSALTGPGGLGSPGRFPRWRGWLEKRALERHLERLDIAATQGNDPVQRKKSWGAGVNDEDALSDVEDQEEHEIPAMKKGPLHLHYFGSRFISHLPSLPLCSAFLDIPPPPQSTRTGQRLLRRTIPEGVKRKVLLIGTADGLFVAENRRRGTKPDSLKRSGKMEGKRKEQGGSDWNGNIRCRKVWTGLGVYQMSILNSKAAENESRSSKYGFSFLASPPQDVSILLALCSTVKDTTKAPVVFTSAQPNNAVPTASSSSKDSPSTFVTASHFETGNGGGPAKVSPPSGSGTVRMWSLEALRRVVAHTLDAEEPREIDVLYNKSRKNGNGEKKSKLAMKIRKAWASLGEPSSDRKARRNSRHLTSQSMSEDRNATPMINEYRSKMSAEPEAMSPLSPAVRHRISTDSDQIDELGQGAIMSEDDRGYEESLRLAQSSVLIKIPGNSTSSHQPPNLGQGESFTSLNSDASMGLGPTSTSGHGSSTHSHTSAGKGVLFFSVFEASAEVGTTGTWYLALATTKSIYLYEASRPSNVGESRTWVFIKEYFAPLPPRGIAFTYTEASESSEEPQQVFAPSRKNHHSQQSLLQSVQQQYQVKSSPYSSVFRSHSDLTLFVSFGKRAILIRAGDASVREVEKSLKDDDVFGSASSDAGHGKIHSANAHKRRSLSAELLGGTESAFGSGQWIGAEKVTSEVIIRCKHHSALNHSSLASSSADRSRPLSRFDGDDDDDDDDDDDEPVYDGLGLTLEDVPLPLNSTSRASQLLSSESAVVQASTTTEPAHTLQARIALLTKGVNSHIFALPLSWDLHQQRSLGVFTWSGIPTAVMAWSKVIGLERDLSSGPTSITSLGASRKKSATEIGNSVTLHVNMTAVAFLSSKIELKRKKIKVVVKVPFVFNRDSELVLEPIAKEDERDAAVAARLMVEEEEEEEAGTRTDSATAVSAQEDLEYLCGLLSVTPKGYEFAKPWEAGNDAGAWAFDWRGASDYRLFFVSAQV